MAFIACSDPYGSDTGCSSFRQNEHLCVFSRAERLGCSIHMFLLYINMFEMIAENSSLKYKNAVAVPILYDGY